MNQVRISEGLSAPFICGCKAVPNNCIVNLHKRIMKNCASLDIFFLKTLDFLAKTC